MINQDTKNETISTIMKIIGIIYTEDKYYIPDYNSYIRNKISVKSRIGNKSIEHMLRGLTREQLIEIAEQVSKNAKYISKLRVCGINSKMNLIIVRENEKFKLVSELIYIALNDDKPFTFDCKSIDNGNLILTERSIFNFMHFKIPIKLDSLNLEYQTMNTIYRLCNLMKLNYYVSNGTIEKRSKPKFVEPIYNNNFADELGLTIKKFIEIYLDHDYCKDQNENHVNQYSLDSLGFNFTTFADMMLHILIIKLMSQTSNESVSLCNDMLKLLDNLFLVTNSNRDRSSVKNKETVEIENHLLDKFSKFLNNPITDTSNTKLVRELVEASTELLEIRYSSNGKRAKVMYSR